MGFKLGSTRGSNMRSGMIEKKFSFNKDDASIPGNPVYRVKLDSDGEANKDGNIYISDRIEPGSKEEKEILTHEISHMVDLKTGKLAYSDNSVRWNGERYARQDGMINFNGQWLPEGDKSFPWEIKAYKK